MKLRHRLDVTIWSAGKQRPERIMTKSESLFWLLPNYKQVEQGKLSMK